MGFLTPIKLQEILDKNNFTPEIFIETGTYIGRTIIPIASNFDFQCFTIEIVKEISDFVKEKSNKLGISNIEFIVGKSEIEIKNILNKVGNKKILFFLDAHSSNYEGDSPENIHSNTKKMLKYAFFYKLLKFFGYKNTLSTDINQNKLNNKSVPLLEELKIINDFKNREEILIIIDDLLIMEKKFKFADWTEVNLDSIKKIFHNRKIQILKTSSDNKNDKEDMLSILLKP